MASNTLVIFDLVSTLTNAGPRYARAFHDVCSEFGVAPPQDEDILNMLGEKNLKQITDHFASDLTSDKKHEFMAKCNTACDALLFNVNWIEHLYQGAKHVLKTLTEQGCTLGIFTGTREDAMESQLNYHEIRQFFHADYLRGKNNDRDGMVNNHDLKIQQLSSIVAQFKQDRGENVTIYVLGDSKTDFLAASELGLNFIGFTDQENKRQQLQENGAETIIGDYKDFPFQACFAQSPSKPKPINNLGF